MFLGLDIGGSYCKAVLIDQDKKVVCSERVPMPPFILQSSPNSYIFEVGTDEILDIVISLLKKVKTKVKRDIQGIGVAGQMHGVLLVDKSNKPQSNFISWQDKRTTRLMHGKDISYLDFLKKHLPDLRCRTGTDLRPGMLGPVLFWLKQNKYLYLSKSKVTFLSDFIVAYLTESEIICDPTQAAGSGVYSLVDNCWSKSYLEVAKISEGILPRVVKSGTESGQVSDFIARKVGIKQGIPIYTSIGDYQAALFSSKIDERSLSINVGTGAQVTLLNKTPIYSNKFETRPFFDNYYLNCISGLPAGRAIELFEKFVNNAVRIFSGHASKYDIIKKLDSLGVERSIKTRIICDPHFFTRENTSFKPGFSNINSNNFSIVALYYALLEGIVREYKNAYNFIKDIGNKRVINKIILSGGVGRKSRTISKLIEKYFVYKIIIPKYEEEAAVGAALFAKKYHKN